MSAHHRHVPLRRCVACRSSLPKSELIRLVRDESSWRIDESARAGGRGTWVCHACAAKLDERDTKRALARTFRQDAQHVSELLRASMESAVQESALERENAHGTERAAASATRENAQETEPDTAPDPAGKPARKRVHAKRPSAATTSKDSRHGGTHG